jgi:hypothetical protein
VEIETTHHVDTGDIGGGPGQGFRYEYDLYRFTDDTVAIVARSYRDQPEEAHFPRIEADGQMRMLEADDLRRPLFEQAANYLRGIGKVELSWLSERAGGYEPVPLI